MGTRGVLGIVVNQREKIAYNHFDSYPEGLGVGVLIDLKKIVPKLKKYKELANAIRLVDEKTKASLVESRR